MFGRHVTAPLSAREQRQQRRPSRVTHDGSVAASADFVAAFPGAHVGVLRFADVSNGPPPPSLAAALHDLEQDLRDQFANADRAALLALPSIAAYLPHYRAFGQTYHVLRQLESVALKGRPLASPGGSLVSAMFAAEVRSQLLTAGHDAERLQGDLLVDCSREGDRFVGIRGDEVEVRPGDMVMRDRLGIVSAVLYGPDQRTRLAPTTRRAVFVTYTPAGISTTDLRAHLERIASYVRLASPAAQIAELCIVPREIVTSP